MAITKLQPFNLDTTANYTFANITATNANLGNQASANYFIGSGANLTSLPAGNISGQVANSAVAGTVYTNAQPNITSVGTLTGLTSNGVVDFTNTSNTTLGAVGNIHITGGTNAYVLSTDGAGNLSWVAQSGGGGGSNISNGNSNVNIPTANGNINFTSVGNTTMVITGTGVNIAGTLNTTGNATVGNLISNGSGGNISNVNVISANTFVASGNVNANNFIAGNGSGGNISNANVISANTFTASGNITAGNANLGNATSANYFIGNFYGTANLATYATTANSVDGANVSGAVTYASTANAVAGANVSGQVANSLVSGTVYTAAQPNITSVGTLTGLTSNGVVDFTNSSNTSLGAVGNIHITGGTNAYVLSTDGAGNLSWVAQSGGGGGGSSISNGNSNVSIATANGNITMSAVGNANIVVVTGTGANIAGTVNATGNITANNFIAGNGTGGNISNANVISANTFTASGNITAANASLGNAVTANYFTGNFYGTANSATTAGTVTTASQPNITSTGSLTGLTVSNATGVVDFTTTANVTLGAVSNLHITGGTNAYVLSTDGAGNLSWVAQSGGGGGGSSISNGNSNVSIATANGNITMSAVGNANIVVVTGTGANIAGTINVTGNAVVGNLISSGSGGNISNVNVVSANTFTASGNITANNISTTGVGGNISNANVISANTFTASGNVTAGNLIGTFANGNSNVNIPTANGNINFTSAGNTIMVITGTGINAAGTIAGTQLTSNIATGTAPLVVTSTTQVANLNSATAGTVRTAAQPNITSTGTLTSLAVTGNVTSGNVYANTGTIGASLLTGTLTTAAQPNITSTGSLTGLTVSNATGVVDFTTTANVTLGAVANLHITGGSSGYVLQTDGSGGLSWVGVSTTSISNGNSNVDITTANGNVTISSAGNTVMVITGTGANLTGNLTPTGTIVQRITSIASGSTVTLNCDTTDLATQTNTETAGTLTMAAVSGTPLNGQKIMFRLQSANVQTFSWNAVFKGSTDLALPTESSGSNKYDYMGFIYNATASKWQMLAKNFGF